MFVQVGALTQQIDKEIVYVEEAKKFNYNDADFQEYMDKMQDLLIRRVRTLEKISSNQALINRYFNKINRLFNVELKRTEQPANSDIGEAFRRLFEKYEGRA